MTAEKALGRGEASGRPRCTAAIASLPVIERDLATVERIMADPDIKAAVGTGQAGGDLELKRERHPSGIGSDPGIGGQ